MAVRICFQHMNREPSIDIAVSPRLRPKRGAVYRHTAGMDEADGIEIQGRRYVLVEVGGGNAVHLAPTSGGNQGDLGTRTVCGRISDRVAGPSGVPSCRRCLASIDRLFPTPVPDGRIGLIAALAVDALRAHGYAEVVGVPGDQMPALRRAVRAAIRKQLGYSSQTFVHGSRLLVSSAEAYAPHAERHLTEAARAMDTYFTDEKPPPIDDSGWRFHWATWAVS